MSVITNYWPDPRFENIGNIAQINCSITGASHDSDGNVFPRIVIKTTSSGDARAELSVSVPTGLRIVVACKSGNDGNTPNVSSAITVWTLAGSMNLTNLPANGGVSREFVVPADGFKICFRAPNDIGQSRWVGNIFVGTLDDYQELLKYVPSGFLAGDLMPKD